MGHTPNGATYLAQNLQTSDWATIKVVQGPKSRIAGQLTALYNENKALADLGQLQGTLHSSDNEGERHVGIQPFVHGKDFFDVLKQKDLSVETSTLMSLKALEAITKLQEKDNYLHCDIKPENMMWDEKENKCTLVDFGCAAKGPAIKTDVLKGTFEYAAPELNFPKNTNKEVLDYRAYNQKTDLYSMGAVLQKIVESTPDKQHPAIAQLAKLSETLTHSNPDKRPKAKDALHALIKINETLAKEGILNDKDLNSSKALLTELNPPAAKKPIQPAPPPIKTQPSNLADKQETESLERKSTVGRKPALTMSFDRLKSQSSPLIPKGSPKQVEKQNVKKGGPKKP